MSNLVETPSIQIKKTAVEKLSLQQNDCPVPPCTTPLGTPPGQTPPQSPNAQRIQRSNSACISNVELLPCRYNSKQFNKRRNTQLLQSNAISNQAESANSLPVSQVFHDHRLQSLRTIAAGAQKSSNLVSKGLLTRGLSKDVKEDKELREKSPDEISDSKELKETTNKELNKLNIQDDGALDAKLSDNFSNQVKLADGHLNNGDLMNGSTINNMETGNNQTTRKQPGNNQTGYNQTNQTGYNQTNQTGNNQTGHNQPSNAVKQSRNGSSKKHSTAKENERNVVRTFRTSQELDELIKENKRSASIDNDVQKIIATAEMRKNQLLLLLDEHAKIVQEIKMAETTK